MARVAVGGFQHETNTFAPRKGDFELFAEPDGWPGLTRGPALFSALAGYNIGISGLLAGAREQGWDVVPLTWAGGGASGTVTEEAFERIAGMLLEDLRAALPLDGLLLDLHGAMVTEHCLDGEAELLRRVRDLVGPDLPIFASLDLHANLSEEMVALADMLVICRTYPHLDMAATGERAAGLLARRLETGQRDQVAFRRVPFLIPTTGGCTLVDPARALYRRLAELEAPPGVSHLSMACGFNPSDVPHCGPAILAYGPEAEAVEAAADELLAEVLARESAFAKPLWSVEGAVSHAMDEASPEGPPILLADVQDNYGGGTSSDTTWILAELVKRRARNAAVGLIWDSEAAAAAHAAGVGAEVTLGLGGKSGLPGEQPFEARYRVEALGDGDIVSSGVYFAGARLRLGPMALLRLDDVWIVVSSHGEQAADPAMFTHLGLDPASLSILVLKSSVHYRADFQPIAAEVLEVEAPAANLADNRKLDYRNLRPGLRIMPKGPIFEASRDLAS